MGGALALGTTFSILDRIALVPALVVWEEEVDLLV